MLKEFIINFVFLALCLAVSQFFIVGNWDAMSLLTSVPIAVLGAGLATWIFRRLGV